jgi:hypothetical protein
VRDFQEQTYRLEELRVQRPLKISQPCLILQRFLTPVSVPLLKLLVLEANAQLKQPSLEVLMSNMQVTLLNASMTAESG